MLTLKETRVSLILFKIFSILCIFPIQVDVKTGKIQKQTNRVKLFIWKIFYGVGVSHWLYLFGRLIQATIVDREKYFKWDHFVVHFDITLMYAVFYFTGFCLFVKNGQENVMIFNKFFEQREYPVQKMMEQEKQVQMNPKFENGNGNKVSVISASAHESNGQGQHQKEVIKKDSKSESEMEVGPRPLLTWPPQYSLEELMAKLLPLVLVPTVFFTLLIFAIDPTQPQLLYAALPPEYQNSFSFLILLAVEALCLALICFICSFAIVTQVLFFGKVQLEFKRMRLQLRNLEEKFQSRSAETGNANQNEDGARQIKNEIWILRQILKEMRELVVLIELFNRCFPFCIFAWKIYSLTVCIMWYFFVIRHHDEFPLLAAYVAYCAAAVTFMYTVMYEHAFSVPGKMEQLKNEFLLTAQKITTTSASNANSNANSDVNKNTNKVLWAELKREIGRIRGVGIKVGSFHQMERESTPNFIDFVFNQVVTLLVTFK